LIASIDAVELSPFRFHLTASFGWRYDFDDASFAPAEAIPNRLLPLRAKAARFAGLRPGELVQALLIRYDPGAGKSAGTATGRCSSMFSASRSAPATMRFWRRRRGGFDRAAAVLESRSIYNLTGEARHGWEHSIAPIEVTRWSVTFRSLSEQGRLRT
jgi:DNA oxidative demethylase